MPKLRLEFQSHNNDQTSLKIIRIDDYHGLSEISDTQLNNEELIEKLKLATTIIGKVDNFAVEFLEIR